MPTAFSYLRFSSLSQSGGASIRRQNDLRDGWLSRHPDVPLDTSLKLTDKGISGWTGEHRHNPDRHALATFLHAVELRRVKPGDYLLVENLDRLTREDIQPALSLCLNLLQAGIKVVQLAPMEIIFTGKSDAMHIMMMIMELSRGHAESTRKSQMVGEAWAGKKAAAARIVLTHRVPGWVQLVDAVRDGKGRLTGGRLVLHPDNAPVLRRMIEMALAGEGCPAIAGALNGDGAVTWDRGRAWTAAGVHKILTSRALTGEYQPHKGRKAKRKPEGEPVPGYYPIILTLQQFDVLAASLAKRKKGGRKGKHVNLFSGLMVDARDGGPIHASRSLAVRSSYFTANARKGVPGAVWSCFPLEGLDRAILSALAEVRLESAAGGGKLDGLRARFAKVEKRLATLKPLIREAEESEAAELVEAIRDLARERNELSDEIEQERKRLASPVAENLSALQATLGSESDRTRLAWAIRHVVSEVRCLFVGGRGQDRVAVVRVAFRDTAEVRHYWIDYTPARNGHQRQPVAEQWRVKPVKLGEGVMPAQTDLMTAEGVRNLEEMLGRYLATVRESA